MNKFIADIESLLLTLPETLYKHKDINNPVKAEIMAKCVLENLSALESIKTITRTSNYNANHKAATADDKRKLDKHEQTRREEWIAKCLKDKKFRSIGQIIDYQTPLKNKQTDGAGKIDLVAYHESKNTVFLLELKNEFNTESLLRCALEIYTYYKQLDHKKFLDDFNIPPDTNIKPTILIFKNGHQHDQHRSEFPNTNKLINALGIKIYTIEPRFEITKEL